MYKKKYEKLGKSTKDKGLIMNDSKTKVIRIEK